MAQFDVCLNPNADSAPAVPYLLEVRSDLLESVSTRVVVPLALLSELGQPASIDPVGVDHLKHRPFLLSHLRNGRKQEHHRYDELLPNRL